ncbi:MAG: PadR family transcriptional regulator, partial [Promethearchaeota archaeon]
ILVIFHFFFFFTIIKKLINRTSKIVYQYSMTYIKDITNYRLKHSHFVVLGLVAEKQPEGCHAYDINRRIEERGMRDWTNIGTPSRSSLYKILESLENNDLLKSYIEEVDNRIRKIYTITDFGYSILKKKVFDTISNFNVRHDEDFDMAFSLFPILNHEEQVKAFTSALKNVKVNRKYLESIYNEKIHCMLNVKGLFIRPIKIIEAHEDFFNWILKEIEGERK